MQEFLPRLRRHLRRLVIYSLVLVILGVSGGTARASLSRLTALDNALRDREQDLSRFAQAYAAYQTVKKDMGQYGSQGIALGSSIPARLEEARLDIAAGKYDEGEAVLRTITELAYNAGVAKHDADLAAQAAAEAAAKKAAEEAAAKAAADAAARQAAETAAKKATPKPTAAPQPAAPVSVSTAYSSYQQKTISTSRGSFAVKVLWLNMNSGHIKVLTDTAADTDCADNCPVMSVQEYVSRNGGFAGVNGTYFCPADYSSCAGKVNSFYWKVYPSRLGFWVNRNNGMMEQDPVLMFNGASISTLDHWYNLTGSSITAGINHWPLLVSGGNYALVEDRLDDKMRYTKGSRAAIGIQPDGNLIWVYASSATIYDITAIMQEYPTKWAMNLDAGGSSALYYSGSYKLGPGRRVPNAIIFAEQ